MDNLIKCSRCGENKLESDFYIRKENGKRRKDCNDCCIKRSVDYVNLKRPTMDHNYEIIDQQYKKCIRCNSIKLGKFFNKLKSSKDGIASHCKECDIKYSQDRIFENNRNRYSEEELSQIKTSCKRCLVQKCLKYFVRSSNTKNGFGSICKDCLNKDIESRRNSKDGKYKYYLMSAKDRGIEFSLTNKEFLNYWRMPCKYCNSDIQTIGLDRVNNKIGYTIQNVVPACTMCNKMKLTLDYNEWISHMRKIISNTKS